MDGLSITIIIACSSFTLVGLYFLLQAISEIVRRKRKFKSFGILDFLSFIYSLLLLGLIAYCVYNAPQIVYRVSSWYVISISGPESLVTIAKCLIFLTPVLYLLTVLTMFFPKENDKPYFLVLCLSIISGFGDSMMVFIVNRAINRSDRLESGLYVYFILGLLLNVTCAFLTRKSLIEYTNRLIYDKRVEMIDKILKAPYQSLENVKREKIIAGLNNDTETISGFINLLVSGVSSIITVACCLIYIYFINAYSFIFTICAIVAGCCIYLSVITSARRFLEKTRDAQNVFLKFINDMMNGIKELFLSNRKTIEFSRDIKESCFEYMNTRIHGEIKFIFAAIASSILINCMLGFSSFLFPSLFSNIDMEILRDFIVVFMFMIGPIININSMIPNLTRIKVSWDRIQELLETLSSIEMKDMKVLNVETQKDLTIQLKDVIYSYKNEEGENFTVGPINYTFRSGEITFITGGNGSGKSTLAKLISGLYLPDKGEVLINGQKFNYEEFGKNYYSTIFSDCHIFEKLYGINHRGREDEIEHYLAKLKIDNKLTVNDGVFSTTKLSTGQRKRMALLVSYLENKPICIFDEWAADQDPEFRKEFYEKLLPELKNKGKCIIAISHDDRYFHVADKVMKMEFGKIVEEWVNEPFQTLAANT